jgi:hypothetical protein
MKDPTPFDDNDYFESLGRGDKKRFRRLFSSKYSEIDIGRARESYKSTFQATDAPEHDLFKDIVDAFSSGHAAGNRSGFETTIINPLCEFGETGADVLLAERNPTGVHLCFVSCDVGGENPRAWREAINNACSLLESEDHRERLLSHIQCSDLGIRTVQYMTFTRDRDLVDMDMEVLKVGTDPDNYAIWKMIEAELPTDDEEDKNILFHDGYIEHSDLRQLSQDGIDPTVAENDDIKYCLTTHPVFPLGEVCLQLYLDKEGIEDEPEEFTRREFERTYKERVHFGANRSRIDWIVSETIDSLLEIGCDYGILEDGEDEVEKREYRIMWDTEDAGDIKDVVKQKYFKGKAPEEMGYLAFERTRDEFEPKESGLDEFGDE